MSRHLWLLALLTLSATASARTLGNLEFSSCTLTSEAGVGSVDAYCSTLEVPENHRAPEGKKITLSLAWIAPSDGEALPDPVFMIAGGPGQSAKNSYPMVARAFSDIVKHRNVILLDQRGTGDSNLLTCESELDASQMMDEALMKAYAETCLATLQKTSDLRYYTTSDAIIDLNLVREAIGAETLNLVGISYGTRVAQQYAKAYPHTVRSVVLDGVVPNTLVLGQDHAKNLDAALAAQFEQCQKSEVCDEKMGDPRETYRQLAAELNAAPREVRYRDATTGEPRQDLLSADMLSMVVRLYAYSPNTASTLPLFLHQLKEGHNDAALAQAKFMMNSLSSSMAHGMSWAVTCSEDSEELIVDPTDADTVMGTSFVQSIKEQCQLVPKGERPADFRTPLQGDIPVLLVSGQLDPVTPPRYGDEVLASLSNAKHLVLNGQGHNVISVGCMPKLMAKFLETADPQSLDTGCLDRLRNLPPFTGYYGWEP